MKSAVLLLTLFCAMNVSWSQDNCTYTCDVPSSFTPNNDGENDILMAQWDCKPEKFEAKIFNRWGQEIFATKDPLLNYGGLDEDGNQVEPGTYFASVEYHANDETIKKTFYFTIIR